MPKPTTHPDRSSGGKAPGGSVIMIGLRQPGRGDTATGTGYGSLRWRSWKRGSFESDAGGRQPEPEVSGTGLSTVLGGWSGGTFASTLLTIADFSSLSRGRFESTRVSSEADRSQGARQAVGTPPARTEPVAAGRAKTSGSERCASHAARAFAIPRPTRRKRLQGGRALLRPAFRGPPAKADLSFARSVTRVGKRGQHRAALACSALADAAKYGVAGLHPVDVHAGRAPPPRASGADRGAAKADRSGPARDRRRGSSARRENFS